jgi:hypothetical protein
MNTFKEAHMKRRPHISSQLSKAKVATLCWKGKIEFLLKKMFFPTPKGTSFFLLIRKVVLKEDLQDAYSVGFKPE